MKRFTSIGTLLLLLFSCNKENMGDCFISAGASASEVRSVPAFQRILLSDRIDMELTQDTSAEPFVEVITGKNLLGRVSTTVVDGELRIGSGITCNWVRSLKERPLVRVSFKHLERLTFSSVGNVSATGPIHGRSFRLEQWDGHGTVRLDIHVDTCWIGLHTGVGNAIITGNAHKLDLYALNFGHIDAGGSHAAQVAVNNSGSGDIRCRATETLDVQVRNVGDVYFAGSPAHVNAQITGSGRLIRLE